MSRSTDGKPGRQPSIARQRNILFVVSLLLILTLAFLQWPARQVSVLKARPPPSAKAGRHPPSAPPSPRSSLPSRPGWTFASSAPPWCRSLLSNPLPFNHCARDRATQACVDDGTVRMLSQYGQDAYLYAAHFSRLRRRGVYLDVAANQALSISNTAFLDLCLGWDGVCVEANPKYHAALRTHRTCSLVPTCVSDVEGQQVKFLLASGSGGIAETNKHVRERKRGKKTNFRATGTITLNCTRLGAVLRKNNVSVVDYLSLDVEGHELMVLKGVNWKRVRFNVITVEISKDSLWAIEKFLVPRGYVRHYPVIDGQRHSLLKIDAIFLHESVTFGDPK